MRIGCSSFLEGDVAGIWVVLVVGVCCAVVNLRERMEEAADAEVVDVGGRVRVGMGGAGSVTSQLHYIEPPLAISSLNLISSICI